MYSLVLMAAVAAGPDVPAAGHGGCWGCGGCTGISLGCSGYASCHGCSGSCHGRGFLGHHRRSGCCGGGGLFGHHKRSCHGCSGCYGSCFGSCYGSCFGSCSGGYAGCLGSCHGCFGGYAYPSYPIPPAVAVPPAVVVPPADTTKPMTKPEDKKKKNTEGDTGASLKFELPADAVLFVDGRQTPGQGRERTFVTPPLAAGQKFFYDVRAEIAVGGITVVEEKRVIVEAGISMTESFPKLFAAVESGATVAGK